MEKHLPSNLIFTYKIISASNSSTYLQAQAEHQETLTIYSFNEGLHKLNKKSRLEESIVFLEYSGLSHTFQEVFKQNLRTLELPAELQNVKMHLRRFAGMNSAEEYDELQLPGEAASESATELA